MNTAGAKQIRSIIKYVAGIGFSLCLITGLSACKDTQLSVGIIGGADGPTTIVVSDRGITSISMDEALERFKTPGDYVIVDVRRADEFADGHIPGAINIPNESISENPPEELPDTEKTVYIYCRSGNRSKQAAEKLVKLGYSGIIEFGGIIDWKGEIEK